MSDNREERIVAEVEGVRVFARDGDSSGPARDLDATAEDESKVARIADRLQHQGYGVQRQELKHGGRVRHTLQASWAGRGEAPENPFQEP